MSWTLVNSHECKSSLTPLRSADPLPGIALNFEIFVSSQGQILNWSQAPQSAFWESLAIKSWAAKVQFYLNLRELNLEWAESFHQFSKLTFSSTAFLFLKKADLIRFAIDKDLQAGDIEIFKFADAELISVFKLPSIQSLSKSEFVKVSEWIIELSQSGALKNKELQNIVSQRFGTELFEKIKSLRTPQAFELDEKHQQKLNQIKLGNGIQAKWTRRGDRSGVEVRFFCSQPKELPRQIQQIERLTSAFELDLKEI